jgi:type 1 fimbria pilin
VATLTTRCQQDAQGTIAAQAMATQQVQEATAVAIQQSTAQAVAIAESTAVAAAATSENLIVRQTEQAMSLPAGRCHGTAQANQMWLSATGTAVAVQASALATAEAQRAENVAMVQEDTQRMLENQRAREAFWNAAWPWIVGVLLVTLIVTAVGAGIYSCGATSGRSCR